MSTFQGWPPEAFAWFEGLLADNSKAYFTAHRTTYDEAVRGPLLELLGEVEDEFGSGKVFRPNRDVRFSHDKSPYKTNTAAVVPGDMHQPGFWVEVSADGMAAGAGYHGADRTQIERFRQAVDAESSGVRLEQIVAALGEAGLEVHGATLKTAPRGYAKDHPRISLLRHTDLVGVRREPVGPLVQSPAAIDWVRDTWRACVPLVTWLRTHL